MQRNRHSPEFKEQALSKARARGTRTLEAVALELPSNLAAAQWSAAQRLLALCSTHGMSGPALAAWCREQGLFEHQLEQWQLSFCAMGVAVPEANVRHAQTQLRELQANNAALQRDLSRKDRALAEAAALLVLQKKFQALWEDVAK